MGSAFCYADINLFVYNVCARKADVEGKRVESRDLIGYNSRQILIQQAPIDEKYNGAREEKGVLDYE